MTDSNPVAEYLRDHLPARKGFHANPVQIDYASAICKGLAHPGQFHFIEGDTGIGKTLGYLVALSDWIARGKQHGRRAIISTFSRSLQRQILSSENHEVMEDYLIQQGLPLLSMGVRMGRQNYVSHDRLAMSLGADSLERVLDEKKRPLQERDLARWALESEGCLLDLDPDLLPEGVLPREIGLSASEKLPESLSRHFDTMQGKDILVINHALLALDLVTSGIITNAEEPYALLLDEAEHYPDAAESILSSRVSFKMVVYLLRSMRMKSAMQQWQGLFDSLVSPRRAGTAETISEASREAVISALSAIMRARPREASHPSHIWDEWMHLRQNAEAISRRLRHGHPADYPIMTFSPVEGLPSIVIEAPSAGSSLKSGWQDRVTLLTSATLSDMNHGLGEAPSYQYVRGRLGLGASDTRLGLQQGFEPIHFGDLDFNLPQDMPNPLFQPAEGSYQLSPTFAKRAIREITALEGRILVLCVSYQDVTILKKLWEGESAERLVSHSPGAPLNKIANGLRDDSILLTPSGWEGLSPTRQDTTFWDHIVILRNPNPAPSETLLHFSMQQLLKSGKSHSEATRIAANGLYRRANVQATHKIRQGIGRAIRHPDDHVMVTILDPRFPRPSMSSPGESMRLASHLLGAIPYRFRPAWRSAEQQQQPQEEDELGIYF